MRFVESSQEYARFLNIAEELIFLNASFPSQVFVSPNSSLGFITNDDLRDGDFIGLIQQFSKKIGEDSFYYLVLEPSPEDYCNDNVSRFKALEISYCDSQDSIYEALNSNSGGQSPDCIMDNSDVTTIFSKKKVGVLRRKGK